MRSLSDQLKTLSLSTGELWPRSMELLRHPLMPQCWRQHGLREAAAGLHIAAGITTLLVASWGLTLAFSFLPFPPSVITLAIFLAILLVVHGLKEWFNFPLLDPMLLAIERPCTWTLKNMGAFFTPGFVELPQQTVLPAREVGLITAWFLATGILAFLLAVALSIFTDHIPIIGTAHQRRKARSDDEEAPAPRPAARVRLPSFARARPAHKRIASSPVFSVAEPATETPLSRAVSRRSSFDVRTIGDYSRRPSSVTLVGMMEHDRRSMDLKRLGSIKEPGSPASESEKQQIKEVEHAITATTSETVEPARINEKLVEFYQASMWPMFFVFTFVLGLILFFTHVDALTLQTSVTALCWLTATRVVPKPWQKFAHPILTTSFFTLLIIWTLGEMRGTPLGETLSLYSTGLTYVSLWRPGGLFTDAQPGAGDLLRSCLDAGIVALALPLYKSRRDLWDNAAALVINMSALAACALLVWCKIAALIGIQPQNALAFAGRFMSAPLAIEFEEQVGGNADLTVVLVIVTGILHVITAPYCFKLLRIRHDDFRTVALTTGALAGAIGTSALIDRPRALAISTCSFAIYGGIILIVAATPASDFIASYVGV